MPDGRAKKRSFENIRNNILVSLSKGQRTVNQIANETGINWKTVDNHLIHLIGRALVSEVFKSDYVKIYELSPGGKDYLIKKFQRKIKILDNKINAKIHGGEL